MTRKRRGIPPDDLFAPFQRHSDTSKAAAVDIAPDAGTLRGKVYELIKAWTPRTGGLTDSEVQSMLEMNPSTQRPRRIELVQMGLVADSGQRRVLKSKRTAVVWKAVDR